MLLHFPSTSPRKKTYSALLFLACRAVINFFGSASETYDSVSSYMCTSDPIPFRGLFRSYTEPCFVIPRLDFSSRRDELLGSNFLLTSSNHIFLRLQLGKIRLSRFKFSSPAQVAPYRFPICYGAPHRFLLTYSAGQKTFVAFSKRQQKCTAGWSLPIYGKLQTTYIVDFLYPFVIVAKSCTVVFRSYFLNGNEKGPCGFWLPHLIR